MIIVYCLNSISYIGGIELVTITKANALSEIDGNEVYICVTDHKNNNVSRKLSQKVKLIDLDINYYSDDTLSCWNVYKGILIKRRKHRKKLSEVLRQINPDIIVSVGQSEKYFLPRIKGKGRLIREMHYTSDYRNFLSKGICGKVIAQLIRYYDFRLITRGYDRVVLLTHEDRSNYWANSSKSVVIPNPAPNVINLSFNAFQRGKELLSVGRLSYQKNFKSLIHVFEKVVKIHPDWKLRIYGEGEERALLEKLITDKNLSHQIMLCGKTENTLQIMQNASIFAMTPRFEGFSLVLVEAMSQGLPVVYYNCPSGPGEIIEDGVDGYLVTPNDEDAMAERICHLIENPDIRNQIGKAAIEKAKKYNITKITDYWMKLFTELTCGI